jgi:hypothetical protein
LLKEGLKLARIDAQDLASLKGSDPRKVAIAQVIRHRSTVSMGWLAEHLAMRSAANVSQQIRRTPQADKNLPKPLKAWAILS